MKKMPEYSLTYRLEEGDMLCAEEDLYYKCLALYPSCQKTMKTVTSNSKNDSNFDNKNGKLLENSINYDDNGTLDYDLEQKLLNPVNRFIHEDFKNRIISIEELSIEIIDDMLIINGDKG